MTKQNIQLPEIDAVVIGTSAGGVEALLKLLPPLPADFLWPILVVIHLPPDGRTALPTLLASRCEMRVKEAEDKEPIEPGTIYFAPANYHLLVEPDRRLSLSSDEPVMYSRPSIDVLFESAADVYGPRLLGIVLTGASTDGARGVRRVCDAGGVAFVEKSAQVPTMPEAAMQACASAQTLTLNEMTSLLQSLVKKGTAT